MPEAQIVARGLQFPESPVWSEDDGCLYLVEWYADRIRVWREDHLEVFVRTEEGGGPTGLCLDNRGNFWVCLYSSRKVVCLSKSGNCMHTVSDFEGEPFRGPCDIAADRDGGIYFTDSGDFEEDWRTGRPAGAVYHITPKGRVECIDRLLCFPNGIALSPGGDRLYVNEHRLNRTIWYRRAADGRFGKEGVFFQYDTPGLLSEESAFELGPDGLCVDPFGGLWVAHYGGAKVVHLNSEGRQLSSIPLSQGRLPTCTAFSPRENAVYITEAEFGLLYRFPL
jgi:gluconolactonase